MELMSILNVLAVASTLTNVLADKCVMHHVVNGNISQISDDNHPTKVWKVQCNPGFELFGQDRIKCRGGVMTAKFPVCARPGCNIDNMPEIMNGRKIEVPGTRGSVFKYRCNAPFKLFGHHGPIGCQGNNKWSLQHIPVCTKHGCDESKMKTLANGESIRLMHGKVYKFSCDEGSIMEGNPTAYCDGNVWNGTKPECLIPPQNVLLSGPSTIGTGPGHKVNFLCTSDVGNPAAKLSFSISEMLSTSSENDILGQLINEKVVELKESKERFIDRQRDMTETNYSRGTTGYITTQELVIHPRVVRKVRGNRMKIQCSSNEDISDAIVVELIRKPTSVDVTGPAKLKYNEKGRFHCNAHPLYINPKPEFSWRVQMGTTTENVLGTDANSDQDAIPKKFENILEITPETALRDYKKASHNDLVVECLVSHPELGDNYRSFTHIVEVLYPPGMPEIHGADNGSKMKEGKNQLLLCKSKAGKPPAKLVWYMGEHMMASQYSVNGDTVQAKITFVPRIEDDGKELRCEARNDAVADPVVNSLVLDVDRATTTTNEPDTTKIYDEFDDYTKMYGQYTNSISNGNKDEYGYDDDDYIKNWTENNGDDNTHMPPELTDELTTDREIHGHEIPAQSEDDFNANIVHKNVQSEQAVEINGDPDIIIREETRSGRNQGNTYFKANGLQSSGNSAVLSKNSVLFSISISIIVMSLCLNYVKI